MPCIIIGLVSIHVRNVGFILEWNRLSNFIVSDIIPAIRILDMFLLIVLVDFFDHSRVIRFNLNLSCRIRCTDHTKAACRMGSLNSCYFIYKIISIFQSLNPNRIICLCIRNRYFIAYDLPCFQFVPQSFYKITKLAITSF